MHGDLAPAATAARGIEDCDALVIGGGPAGLMAACELAAAGRSVLLADSRPSLGRKFLMAGKSGLNLTMDAPLRGILPAYGPAADWLAPMLDAFGPAQVQDWARGLGQEVFTGSSGRVFPVAMKASPLLRAWLARLAGLGVTTRTRWRWLGWADAGPDPATRPAAGDAPPAGAPRLGAQQAGALQAGAEQAAAQLARPERAAAGRRQAPPEVLRFATPEGARWLRPRVTVLALGGASWARLGSDGAWAPWLAARGVALAPFRPANAGLCRDWSAHMAPLFGQPVKGAALSAGGQRLRAEFVISARGLEGGGIYALGPALRDGAPLVLDLAPDLDAATVAARLAARPRRETTTARLRKALGLRPPALALLHECARPLPRDAQALAGQVKRLVVTHAGPRPLDEAISTAGGIACEALDAGLGLRALPGLWAAGEMLDWEAPTGGYLLTACLATGRWAGRAAARG